MAKIDLITTYHPSSSNVLKTSTNQLVTKPSFMSCEMTETTRSIKSMNASPAQLRLTECVNQTAMNVFDITANKIYQYGVDTLSSVTTVLNNNPTHEFDIVFGSESSVTAIPVNQFKNYKNIRNVTLSDAVDRIGNYAFQNASVKTIEIPSGVSSIGTGAFEITDANEPTLESVVIDGVATIPNMCFHGQANLKTVKIHPTVSSIGGSAFNGCTSIETLIIPASVKTILDDAFKYITGTIYIHNKENAITGAPWGATDATIVYCDIDDTKVNVIDMATNEFTTYSTCEAACEYIVENADHEFEFIFGDECGITSVNENSDDGLIKRWLGATDNIVYIKFGSSITGVLGNSYMRDHAKLQAVDFAADCGITSIGQAAFERTSIRQITIPDSVETLTDACFARTPLISLTLGAGVETITNGAFEYTVLDSVRIPTSVNEISNSAFGHIQKLTSITFTPTSAVTTISTGAFQDTGIETVNVPDSVTTIGDGAFGSCPNLTSITIGSGIVTMSERAFLNDTALTSITIDVLEDSVENAPWGATNATITWTGD